MDQVSANLLLPVVRDLPLQPRRKRPVRAIVLHALRLGLVVSILLLIRQQHRSYLATEASRDQQPVDIEILREFFPAIAEGGVFDAERRTQQVVDSTGHPIGFVVQTSPQSDGIVGFSGPTNVLVAFDTGDRILGLKILWSRDTREHVQLIERQIEFLHSWDGTSWNDAANRAAVDGVSGATLTSLAIAESIAARLGGSIPSLRFPEPLDVSEIAMQFPKAATLSPDPRRPALHRILDTSGSLLGYVFRTSPAADNLVGYQGPTDTLIMLDAEEKVFGIRLRHSFDNEPYVRYVKDEDYFLNLFNGRSLRELAKLDLFEARVEGVSGATMTSMNVADAIVLAARHAAIEVKPASSSSPSSSSMPNARQLATLAVLVFSLIIGLSRLRKFRVARLALLVAVITVIGVLNGDMLSLATLVGWTQNGIPWEIAVGLVAVSIVAVLVPATSRNQIYCHQICPHGAVQQLVKKRLPLQPKMPRWLHRTLLLLPFGLLAWCIVVSMLHLPFSLVDLEPFDAWVFKAAGSATIVIAVVGLGASLLVPMTYCRYGCPTGAFLDFLRFNSRSDVWSRADWLAMSLLLLAGMLRFVFPAGSLGDIDLQKIAEPALAWGTEYKAALQWLTASSVVFFVGSLLAVPWLVARIPTDYFMPKSERHRLFRHRHPVVSLLGHFFKNLLGGVLLLAGVAMLILPGQGLLTILLGIMLIDFPGKRRLEILIIRRRAIGRVVCWIRRRAGREQLRFPETNKDTTSE
ncbi:MAG: FMN-binding protein [Planctomycetota bacterium]|nr:FMN-binding protein [Planctomycetota bacterium]MDA0919068.1 FMN-binding protein [Planctomycetota bacterium]